MKILSSLALLLFISVSVVSAHGDDIDEHIESAKDKRRLASFQIDKSVYEAFREKSVIAIPELKVPSVIMLPVSGHSDAQFAIERAKGEVTTFEPFRLDFAPVPPRVITATTGGVPAPSLADADDQTGADFQVLGSGETVSFIELSLGEQATRSSVSGIALDFAEYSARPDRISLTAGGDQGTTTFLQTEKAYMSDEIRFPLSAPQKQLLVRIVHRQPLRIAGIRVFPDAPTTELRGIRFLAQPGLTYTLYSNPDRLVYIPTGEVPALGGGKVVSGALTSGIGKNLLYKPSDADGDGVLDAVDNCQTTANIDQADIDQNGVGDQCDDFDRDGVVNTRDNCPSDPNGMQLDEDGDKKGDVCDGEESRLTEKYTWIPWVAIGFVALVIAGLAYSMVLSRKDTNPPQSVV